MKYFLYVDKQSSGNYYMYKCNYREKGKVKSKYVYLGAEDIALKILSDFNSKMPANERLVSYSGEIILTKMLETIDFKGIINRHVKNGTELDAGRFIEILVIERSLYEYSKWRLANIAHEKSIFSLDAIVPSEMFYENNIYHYMDYIYPNLDRIQKEIVKNLLAIKSMEFNELIIDATSVHCFGGDEIEPPKNQVEKYEQVYRTHGYSRSKRPDLPQINLMLGVNAQYIPLIFDAYSGNAPDPAMFKMILEKCRRAFPTLLERVKGKYLVFDKGNNSKDNVKEIDGLCEAWGCHFVASVRPSLKSVKKELSSLKAENLPVLHEQKHTTIRGKLATISLYGKERSVLLYVNEEIASKEQDELLESLAEIQEKVKAINQTQEDIEAKLSATEQFLRKKRLLSFFKREASGDAIACVPIQEKFDQKVAMSGKFALLTNDFSLDADSVIRIYKTASVIEQEFHVLKSVLSLYPLRHRKKERIKVHCALVIWGAMAFALLKHHLLLKAIDLTFEELKEILKGGPISIGDYVYPGEKSFRIQRTLNFGALLKTIFKILKLNFNYFDISLLPTINEKKEGED